MPPQGQARVCRSSNTAPQRLKKKSNQRSGTTHLVEADIDNASQSSDVGIHSVTGSARYKKLVTSLTLNGTNLKFKVDTGAELSTISWATCQSRLKMPQSSHQMCCYTNMMAECFLSKEKLLHKSPMVHNQPLALLLL